MLVSLSVGMVSLTRIRGTHGDNKKTFHLSAHPLNIIQTHPELSVDAFPLDIRQRQLCSYPTLLCHRRRNPWQHYLKSRLHCVLRIFH